MRSPASLVSAEKSETPHVVSYGPEARSAGLATKVRAGGPVLPWICVVSPLLCWMLSRNSAAWFGGYRFGFELLLLNGLLTAIGVATFARIRTTEHPGA